MPAISQLPVATAVNLGDLYVIVQGGVTKQAADSLVLSSIQSAIQITEAQVTNLTSDLAARLIAANNLSDLTDVTIARSNLELGSIATHNTSEFVATAGGTMTGYLILNADPVTNLGAATKQYVDNAISGSTFQTACVAATTANLSANYNNGASGVGATLTNNSSLAAFSVDGVSPVLNARILVKNQSSSSQNGIYVLTTVGSASIAWVLTRAGDYDMASQINLGDLIAVLSGTVNALTSWLQTATVVTIGTDSINFSEFSASPSTFLQVANNLSDLSSTSTARTNLGLGTAAIANASSATGTVSAVTGVIVSGNLAKFSDTSGTIEDSGNSLGSFLLKANNLSDVANASTSFNNISPLTTKGDLLGYSTMNTRFAVGINNQILQCNSGSSVGFSWSMATYPSTTTINQLLFSSSANTITGLATVTSGVLTTLSGVPTWANQLSISLGGTGVSSVTTTPTASAWAGWDANLNFTANSIIMAQENITLLFGTTALTVASAPFIITGGVSGTIVLPNATTLAVNQSYAFNQNASGTLTVETFGGATLFTAPRFLCNCILYS